MRIDSPQIVGNLSVAEGSEAVLTGSFTGSFTGDGSGLTGVAPIAGTGIDVTGTTVSVDATVATVTYVDGEITGILGGVDGAYDTLLELSASISSGDTDAAALTTTVAGKLQKDQNLSDLTDASAARGNLGLGTSDSVQFNAIGIGTAPSGAVGSILATNDVVAFASSDERLKENIVVIPQALEKIEAIGGYEYDWIAGNEEIHINHGHDLGVIAQEVEKVLPELVTTRDNGYLAVKYDKLTAVLIEAVKELSARVKELESK
jgi:hypothetical protein